MTIDERAVLKVAQVLYLNGQSTDQILGTAHHLSQQLGIRTTVMPRWGDIQLLTNDEGAALIRVAEVGPPGVQMNGVACAMRVSAHRPASSPCCR
jgi:hypothetical protein